MNWTRNQFIYIAIAAGILIPIEYYGLQLVAIPFAKDYNWIRQAASELGMSSVSSVPAVFNLGKIFGSIPTWIAAFGFLFGLRQMGANAIATWLTFFAMIAVALNDIEAGVFPLPDSRHEGPFLIGFPLWSFSFIAAISRFPESRKLRIYLITNILLAVVMLGARIVLGDFFTPFAGLFQRGFAFVTVVPISVGSWFLAARFKNFSIQDRIFNL